MAKAKEWAERFESANELDVELQAFVEEIGTIAKSRGGSPAAIEGAVREQSQKFEAVCRITPRVTPNMWSLLLKAFGKEYLKEVTEYHRKLQPKAKKGHEPKAKAGTTSAEQGARCE